MSVSEEVPSDLEEEGGRRAVTRRLSRVNLSSCWAGLGGSFPRKDCRWKRPGGGEGRIWEDVWAVMFGLFPGMKFARMLLRLAGLPTLGRTMPPGGGRSGVGRREEGMLMFWFLGGKGVDAEGLEGAEKRGRLEGSVATSGAERLMIGGLEVMVSAGEGVSFSTFVSTFAVGFDSLGVACIGSIG